MVSMKYSLLAFITGATVQSLSISYIYGSPQPHNEMTSIKNKVDHMKDEMEHAIEDSMKSMKDLMNNFSEDSESLFSSPKSKLPSMPGFPSIPSFPAMPGFPSIDSLFDDDKSKFDDKDCVRTLKDGEYKEYCHKSKVTIHQSPSETEKKSETKIKTKTEKKSIKGDSEGLLERFFY